MARDARVRRTIGAAEDVAVAFRGRADTRFFGRATAGEGAKARTFELPDGAWVRLSAAYPADRTGTVYRGPIIPDVYVETDMWEDYTVAEAAAVEWLLGTEACR